MTNLQKRNEAEEGRILPVDDESRLKAAPLRSAGILPAEARMKARCSPL